ncbi:MAG: thioredoxin family protein [Spirochaetota bacterium]
MKGFAACTITVLFMMMQLMALPGAMADDNAKVTLYFFYGKDCPSCKAVEPRIDALADEYPGLVVEKYEVWHDKENRDKLIEMARKRKATAKGVPTIIIGDDVYLGSNITYIQRLVQKNTK